LNQILRTENDEWIYERNLVKEQKNIFKVITFLVITLVCVLAISLVIYLFNLNSNSDNIIIPYEENQITESDNKDYSNTNLQEGILQPTEKYAQYKYSSDGKIIVEEPEIEPTEILYSASGDTYSNIGIITIDKINLHMDIISKTTEELMTKSACKLWGPSPNRVGNLCIIGHNWRNTKLFSKVPYLEVGDTFKITDLSGITLTYEIYDKYTVYPEDTECLEQETEGRKEVTLITCTNDSTQRYVLHAVEI